MVLRPRPEVIRQIAGFALASSFVQGNPLYRERGRAISFEFLNDPTVNAFATDHPLYQLFAELAKLRVAEPALRRGAQLVRASGPKPGLFAVSRFDPATGRELLLAFNTGTTPVRAQVQVGVDSRRFLALHGECPLAAGAPGSVHVDLPPLGFAICAAAP